MDLLIFVIIIAAVVCLQIWKAAKRKPGRQQRKMAASVSDRAAREAHTPGDSEQRRMPSGENRRTRAKASGKRPASAKRPAVSQKAAPERENILTAARENTVEVAVGNDMDALASAALLNDVYEIMVKGPQDTLTFSRDFVAEGTELLNRYTLLPDTDLF